MPICEKQCCESGLFLPDPDPRIRSWNFGSGSTDPTEMCLYKVELNFFLAFPHINFTFHDFTWNKRPKIILQKLYFRQYITKKLGLRASGCGPRIRIRFFLQNRINKKDRIRRIRIRNTGKKVKIPTLILQYIPRMYACSHTPKNIS